jgi:hypothetical protein
MIWRSVRHTNFVELTAWAIVLLLVLLLSLADISPAQFDGYTPLGFVLFVGLCLLIYRLRNGRL